MKSGVRGQGPAPAGFKRGAGVREKLKETALKAVKVPLRFMPLWVEAIGMGAVMGMIVDSNKRFKERLKEIDNKIFLFEATDLDKKFYLHIKDNDIKIIPHTAKTPDVVMKGETKVFYGLLLRSEEHT